MTEIPIYNKFGGNIKDLFDPTEKYTFLVGAGISMDAPTNMPSARQIVRTLLEIFAPPEEFERILSLDKLRYELVVDVIAGYFDKQGRFLDYLELVNEPNLIHILLAALIKEGHFCVTTNFDYMIELALKRILTPNLINNIYPIITKDDFINFNNPQLLFNNGKYSLYKIHGSKRNIITGVETIESLITTIAALGIGREEGETFAIEPFKKEAVFNLMNNRTLIMMGYSGSDDFDIGPMLKEIPFLNRIIWIDHSQSDEREVFQFLKTEITKNFNNLTQQEQLLATIRNKNNFEVFLIKAHTMKFVKEVLWPQLINTSDLNDINVAESSEVPDFSEWAKNMYGDFPILDKYALACQIYKNLTQYEFLKDSSEKALELSLKIEDDHSKAIFLSYTAFYKQILGNYEGALTDLNESFEINKKLNNIQSQETLLSNIGRIYLTLGKFREAFECFNNALQVADQIGDIMGKIFNIINIAKLYEMGRQFDLALQFYNDALSLTEEIGKLDVKTTILNNIGHFFSIQGKFDEALKYYDTSIKISEQLGDLSRKLIAINNIGRILQEKDQIEESIGKFTEAMKIAEQLGDISRKAKIISNIGSILKSKKDFEGAIEKYKESLLIETQLGDPLMKSTYLNNIASVYEIQGDQDMALIKYKEGFEIIKDLGHSEMKAMFLSKIGTIYFYKKEFEIALDYYTKALFFYDEIKDYQNKVAILSNLGKIKELIGNLEDSLRFYNDAVKVNEEIGDLFGKATVLNNIAKILENQNDFISALEKYNIILSIFQELKQEEYITMIQNKIDELKSKLS